MASTNVCKELVPSTLFSTLYRTKLQSGDFAIPFLFCKVQKREEIYLGLRTLESKSLRLSYVLRLYQVNIQTLGIFRGRIVISQRCAKRLGEILIVLREVQTGSFIKLPLLHKDMAKDENYNASLRLPDGTYTFNEEQRLLYLLDVHFPGSKPCQNNHPIKSKSITNSMEQKKSVDIITALNRLGNKHFPTIQISRSGWDLSSTLAKSR